MNATTIRKIVNIEIAKSDLDPVTAQRVRTWASKWEADWSRDRFVTARAVTAMTRNCIAHYKGV